MIHLKIFFFVLYVTGQLLGSLVFATSFESDYVVSNYPEGVYVPGLIFDKPFDKAGFRILYHHRNISTDSLSIVIALQNLSLKEERVFVRAGLGGSTSDVVFAGHKAAQTFLAQYANPNGFKAITLSPLSSTYVLSHLIKPDQTSSGIVQLYRENSYNLRVKMGIVDNRYPHLSSFSDIASGINQYRVAHFQDILREEIVHFDSVDQIMSLEVGGKPYLVDLSLNYELTGNYGVLHQFNIKLSNSLSKPTQFNFYLAPKKDNAVDRAVFLINGKLTEVGVSFNKDNEVSMQNFYSIFLKPKEKKEITFITLPQSGCYYPVDVIIRAMEGSL